MGLFSRKPQVIIGDAKYDNWPVVADYPDIDTARAFRDQMRSLGYTAELTSDWPLKNNGEDDIALRVTPHDYADATVALEYMDPDYTSWA